MCVEELAGEPKKTAGPILRGAARSRTLQEGTKCVLRVGGEPMKTAGPITAKSGLAAAHSRRDQMCIVRLAVSPEKPQVPHCEERPGAAPSRRDQLRVQG